MLPEQTSAGRASGGDWSAGSQLKSQGNGLALEGPSVGLYVPLLEFNQFVGFDRPRVVRVLERIAADLDILGLVPNDPHADKESNHHDPRARHRHELAEPPPKPKKLSHREQRTALRAALGLPPQ